MLPNAHETPHFTIRAYRPGDARALHRAKQRSYEHLKPWMPWAQEAQGSLADDEALVDSWVDSWQAGKDFLLSIWSPGGDYLGGTGFHPGPYGLKGGVAEIGLWIVAEEAGQGLGTEVLVALLAWGFHDWPWQRLFWRCNSRNVASRRVALKAGMVHEGTHRSEYEPATGRRRDTEVYARARPDMEAALRERAETTEPLCPRFHTIFAPSSIANSSTLDRLRLRILSVVMHESGANSRTF